MIAAIHLIAWHHGELVVYHVEGVIIMLIVLAFLLGSHRT